MADQLSEGAIMTILSGGEVLNPVLQVLGSRKLTGNVNSERYRLLISDGVYCNSYAMLATQLNHMVDDNQLAEYSIIRVNRHLTSMVNNQQKKGEKRVLILLDITLLKHGSEVGIRIGNPQACDGADKASTNGGPAPVAPAQPQYRPSPSPQNNSGFGGNRASVPGSPMGPLDSMRTHPIVGLSPYQNKWVIKARVTSKTPVRQWSNARGEGKLFSMDLMDDSGEIRATAFKEQCDKFYDMIEPGKVYFFSRCQLKPANKKFSNLNNDYEMTFTGETQVVPCQSEDDSIPQIKFNFVPLQSLADTPPDTIVDLIGVCKSATDLQNLVARTTNRELKKREITLVDHSLTAVSVTLWGTQAEEFDASLQPIVAIKGARVSEYNGSKSVSLVSSSNMQLNPDMDESHKLRGWFDNYCQDSSINFNNISGRQTTDGGAGGKLMLFKEAKDANLGAGDKPDYFSVMATMLHIRTDRCLYKACPSEGCNKKVIDQNTGYFRCEKCNREFDSFKWRFLFSAQIADWTGAQWVNVFHDQAIEMLGVTPEEVARKQETEGNITECFANANFQEFLFKLRAKVETYNDESRMKMSIVTAKKPDIKDHCRKLIASIKEMAGINTDKTSV
uniref:Replication protein A subunit n=1 Tax=Graphocephala atropunctata TaxID=36148 RepID=A0A1B6MN54_9HEMI